MSNYEKHIYKVIAFFFFIIVIAMGLSFGKLISEVEASTVLSIKEVKIARPEPSIEEAIIITEEITTEEIIEEEAIEQIPQLDIPLSQELIDFIWEMSQKYEIEYELIVAVIAIESDFKTDCISNTNDYGLMQINKSNHKWLKKQFGFTDFTDPYQNIEAGCIILKDCFNNLTDYHAALMGYNMGQTRARNLIKQGKYSSKYSRKVMSKYYEYTTYQEMETQ